MRGLRSTLALLVVLIGLGGYIYFVEWKKPPTEAGEQKEKVFPVDAAKIEELKVRGASGTAVSLKKTDGSWQLIEPDNARADESEVSSITSSLASLEIQRVVEEKAANLKDFGLDPPRVEVAFKASGDKDFKRLLIGEKTLQGSGDLYARRDGNQKVFLISGYLDGTFNRTPFDLRDKTILRFERDKIGSVELSTPSGGIEMKRSAGEWSLVKPLPARGDYGTIEGLIGRLQTTQMKSIVEAGVENLRKYGLDRPEITATVVADSSRASLALGKKSDDGNIYARDVARPLVFTVESSLLEELKKPPAEYRRKDVFEFRAFNANRIEIQRASEVVAFEKVKGQGKEPQDKWRQVAPAARDVDQTKMDSLLTKLANLRAQSFADAKSQTGLNQPTAIVTVRFDDSKKEERISFGRAGSDVYASRKEEAGAAKLDASEFDAAMKALDELK